MITLNFSKKSKAEKEKIVNTYVAMNLQKRNVRNLSILDRWCALRLAPFDPSIQDFHALLSLEPEALLRLADYLDALEEQFPSIHSEMMQNGSYVISSLYSGMNKPAKAHLLKALDIRVCPYCNRNFINSDGDVNTCEIDHFLPKSRYPILAACFYNLIPVCPVCNRKKNDRRLKYYPHIQRDDEPIRISYELLGADYLKEDHIKVNVKAVDPDYQNDLSILELETIYQTHKKEVQELLKKETIFTDTYISALQSEFPGLFQSREEVLSLIYGVPERKEEYANVPLAKLKSDILNDH